MKYTLLLAAILLLTAATGKWKLEDKNISKLYAYVPAGNLNGTDVKEFYMSSIEVTNKQYRDFLNAMYDSHRYDKWRDAKVDTAQWRTYLTYNDPYANHYFQNPKYDNYPVVNISQRGAQLYCEWITENYNKTAKRKVEFRLPTEAEWMWAAKGGDANAIYPWQGNSLTYTKKGKYQGEDLANYKHYNALALTVDKATGEIELTAPSLSYLPNKYNIWNMAGNVAEMTTDPSYVKGGGWATEADMLKIGSRDNHDGKPCPNVGFRPVVVLK